MTDFQTEQQFRKMLVSIRGFLNLWERSWDLLSIVEELNVLTERDPGPQDAFVLFCWIRESYPMKKLLCLKSDSRCDSPQDHPARS